MQIGIIGAGRMGGQIGLSLARAGHQVLFSYSRSSQRLLRLAAAAGDGAQTGSVA